MKYFREELDEEFALSIEKITWKPIEHVFVGDDRVLWVVSDGVSHPFGVCEIFLKSVNSEKEKYEIFS